MQAGHMFATADDVYLSNLISRVSDRLVYVAPGVGKATAAALVDAITSRRASATIILDADADSCRVGYGDAEALAKLHDEAVRVGLHLRKQEGLRIGLLVADADVVIWSPTAQAVEAERIAGQPNAIVLSGPVVEDLRRATGGNGDPDAPTDAEIGCDPLSQDELEATLTELRRNPPAPFDLTRRTRVFSTRFQYVEFEIKGAEWTDRKMKVSSFLLNADLPEDLQELLETQVRPFQRVADVEIPVPHLVMGQAAYDRDGKRMIVPATQSQVVAQWHGLRGRYLHQVRGFGWLIRRDDLRAFREEAAAYEETLRAWVDGFRKHVLAQQHSLAEEVVAAIRTRLARAAPQKKLDGVDLRAHVQAGFERLRVTEPAVRIVTKDVAWESARDVEFIDALEQALPKEDLEGWFEEFTAARERS